MLYPRIPLIAFLAVFLLAGAWVPGTVWAQSSFEHAPGTESYRKGVRAYEAERYWQAAGFFRSAARWADKSSQFYLGVMYYNGDGVERDHARAWAWFELSAEREYPQMVAMANDLWSKLSEDERERGRRILEEELRPAYGDATTVPRTHRRMQQERRRMSGSRLAVTPGALEIYEGTSEGVVQNPTRSRYDFYAKENWDFYALLEKEAEMLGERFRQRVELRDEPADEEDS